MALISRLPGGGGNSVIKHIQRGAVKVSTSSPSSITLSGFTDLSKMIVLIDGAIYQSTSSVILATGVYVDSLTLTRLTLNRSYLPTSIHGEGYISYQVIEFN
jgi:hypothetical protein